MSIVQVHVPHLRAMTDAAQLGQQFGLKHRRHRLAPRNAFHFAAHLFARHLRSFLPQAANITDVNMIQVAAPNVAGWCRGGGGHLRTIVAIVAIVRRGRLRMAVSDFRLDAPLEHRFHLPLLFTFVHRLFVRSLFRALLDLPLKFRH